MKGFKKIALIICLVASVLFIGSTAVSWGKTIKDKIGSNNQTQTESTASVEA